VAKNRLYDNWQSLLDEEQERLDAVVVLTPTPQHAEMVIAAINHGIPVICEKALAASPEDAAEISKALKAVNGYLAVTYNYTGYPMVRELKWLIQNGALGDLQQIHVEMPQEGYQSLGKGGAMPAPQDWRLHDGSVSTLSLDLGVHMHHLILFLCHARPVELVALNNTYGFFSNVVDNTICLARYTDNIHCHLWFSKSALGHSNGLRIRLYGSKGSAEWVQLSPEEISLTDNSGEQTTLSRSSARLEVACQPRYCRFKPGHPSGFIEAFANLYYDIADDLIEYKSHGTVSSPWVYGAEAGFEGLQMLKAITTSASTGNWCPVDVET
jgi:predicted dehydrogenase